MLVDAHALIFQVFHAIREPMTGPDGRPTNALFGFTRDLFTLRDSLKPDYLVCAFDCAGPTFRNAIAADYKAHRPPPPDDLQLQVPLIHRRQVLKGLMGERATERVRYSEALTPVLRCCSRRPARWAWKA